jgi:uncharacterized protein YdeI (YjbR/CyaY-like superfamily)
MILLCPSNIWRFPVSNHGTSSYAPLKKSSPRRLSFAFGGIHGFERGGESEMTIRKTLYVTSREAWRAWLTKHYESETEVWLIYYKKHSGQPRISYDHAVEEALCFGWIDSIVKTIDDEKFAQRFTPRRDWTRWSALNKQRLRKLIREGRMTEAGLAKIDRATLGEEPHAKRSQGDLDIPHFVKQALMTNAKAWENFRKLAPSHRRGYIQWIMDAKKEETRERRLREAVSRLERRKGDPDDIPVFIKEVLMANAKAWDNFRNLAPSYRRHYIGWIMHAANEETRERRLREAVSLLEQNKKLGLK